MRSSLTLHFMIMEVINVSLNQIIHVIIHFNIIYGSENCHFICGIKLLRIGSLLSDSLNAGAGGFSEIFSFSMSLLDEVTAFDGETAAIRTALSQLQWHLEQFTRAVILCDSRTVLLAIVSDNNPKTEDILDCRYLKNLASFEKTIILSGFLPTEGFQAMKADFLAKKGALITQNISCYCPPSKVLSQDVVVLRVRYCQKMFLSFSVLSQDVIVLRLFHVIVLRVSYCLKMLLSSTFTAGMQRILLHL
ncbi:hypothetical protein CEXT_664451 [Caerostris extrusa]|uniref:Uncharacterized protein n=1 Tax=Caerostris extrusa TaxID=172846 RepID=A0AAV4SUE4_CAEEX|nr:hypothetical protein CEXT_664451 [Caerostris extrusa]